MNQQVDQLTSELSALLRDRNMMVTTVESCTGGLIAEVLTRIPGSSEWFERGFVTYSNSAKQDLVGVETESLEAHGAVSRQVAREMAMGGIHSSQADLAISVTGIAGPDGGSKEKPVGTVWMAWAHRSGTLKDQKFVFPGDRQQVRVAAVQSALIEAIDFLKACD